MKLRALILAAALALGAASAAGAASAGPPSPDQLITDATRTEYMRGGWRHHRRHYRRHHRRHRGWHRGRHYGWYHHRRHYGWRHHRRHWGGRPYYRGHGWRRYPRWGAYNRGGYGYATSARYAAPVVTGSVGPRSGDPGRHLGWYKHGGPHEDRSLSAAGAICIGGGHGRRSREPGPSRTG